MISPEMAGMGNIGGSLISGVGGLLSSQSAAKAAKAAAEKYLAYLNGQRQLFLDQPETQAARPILQKMIGGTYGFDPDALQGMYNNVQDTYSQGLAGIPRQMNQAGVMPGSGYAPGRRDRTMRLLQENMNVNKAEQNRTIAMANAQQQSSNQRFGMQQAPTYMPGIPSTALAGPGVFQNMEAPNAISPIGSMLTAGGQGVSQGATTGMISSALNRSGGANPYFNADQMTASDNPWRFSEQNPFAGR